MQREEKWVPFLMATRAPPPRGHSCACIRPRSSTSQHRQEAAPLAIAPQRALVYSPQELKTIVFLSTEDFTTGIPLFLFLCTSAAAQRARKTEELLARRGTSEGRQVEGCRRNMATRTNTATATSTETGMRMRGDSNRRREPPHSVSTPLFSNT